MLYYNAGPVSQTMDQQWPDIGPTILFAWLRFELVLLAGWRLHTHNDENNHLSSVSFI